MSKGWIKEARSLFRVALVSSKKALHSSHTHTCTMYRHELCHDEIYLPALYGLAMQGSPVKKACECARLGYMCLA